MSLTKRILFGCLLAILAHSVPLRATTIIPFTNLGEMALAADAVVVVHAGETRLEEKGDAVCRRTPFTVTEVIKGELTPGANIDMDSWWRRSGNKETTIWGDPTYNSGTTYLVFLAKLDYAPYWQPMMLAYGQFYRRTLNGVDFFFPSRESSEIHAFPRPDGIVPETMKVMLAKELLTHLKQVVSGKIPWQEMVVLPEGEVKDVEVDLRVAPMHCSFLDFGGTYARYIDFPADDILVYSQLGGDPSLSPPTLAYTYVSNAVDALSADYQGINLNYSGTLNFTPDCVNNHAYDGNFYTVVGSRESLVIFDDPCNEIANLTINGINECAGTLAVGGLWAGGTHTFDGVTWYNGIKSYVVLNNDLGICTNIDYTIVLIHELTHGLGNGHIASGNGAANMNPSCCNTIKQLDIDCLDYTYPPAPLPIELVTFTANIQREDVLLNWSTASEINNDRFVVERSLDGKTFTALSSIPGNGTTNSLHEYSWTDHRPGPSQWYYRLKQLDLDGRFAYSPIVTVNLEGKSTVSRVYPNPISGNTITLQRQASREGEMQVDIIALDQSAIQHQFLHQQKGGNLWEIPLPDIQPGIYFLRLMDDNQTEVIRFCIAR